MRDEGTFPWRKSSDPISTGQDQYSRLSILFPFSKHNHQVANINYKTLFFFNTQNECRDKIECEKLIEASPNPWIFIRPSGIHPTKTTNRSEHAIRSLNSLLQHSIPLPLLNLNFTINFWNLFIIGCCLASHSILEWLLFMWKMLPLLQQMHWIPKGNLRGIKDTL